MTDTGADSKLPPNPKELRNIALKIKRPIQLGALLMILIFTYPLINDNGPLATRYKMGTYILLGLLVIAFIIASALKPIEDNKKRTLIIIVLFLPIIMSMAFGGYAVLKPPPDPGPLPTDLYTLELRDTAGNIPREISAMQIHLFWDNTPADEGHIDPGIGTITYKVVPEIDKFNHKLILKILSPNYIFQNNDSSAYVLNRDTNAISLRIVNKFPPTPRGVSISPKTLSDLLNNCHPLQLDSIEPGTPLKFSAISEPDAFIPNLDNPNEATVHRDCHVLIRRNGKTIWKSPDVIEDIGTVPQAASIVRNQIAKEIDRILSENRTAICNSINRPDR